MIKTTETKLFFLLIIFSILLLCFSSAKGADMGEIKSAETRTSYLSSSDSYQDSWTFYGVAGDRVIITTARLSGGVDPCIYLYSPSGGPYEDAVCGLDNNYTLNHQLEETGLYTIIIRDYNNDEEGDYSISLTKIPSTERPGIYDPFPSNGESISNLCNSFSWRAVTGATGYDFYFGEDVIFPLIKIEDNLTSNSMPFPAMEFNKIYYWHVVAHTPGGDIQGPYWWFETIGYEDDTIVLGLGAPEGKGYFEVVEALPPYSHLDWVRVPWPKYNTANGATHPTAGDFDGDCKDELAIGLGTYTATGGYVEIKDDAGMGFSHLAWPRVPWPVYNTTNGATYPAAGDFDGDNKDELFIGLGTYPTNGGYVEIKDDNSTGFTHLGWPRVHWPTYNNANGETRPSLGH
jgi:hypothetical protein